ncbi:hypothetical protein N2603_20740 [Bradyrhizobium huanghuaihaiense]|uniref:hypothetical protein n=1 Tax=Bradyrhizobium huanghuaihaiense TaxID=990078 RepID=UPI0021AA974C|nr:hypothetical protein [Bradyrhizobium sp. CB3035]UWU80800.1 hypothetical protein N2603_20740 [Bradyrhizobium sp. CB3035]
MNGARAGHAGVLPAWPGWASSVVWFWIWVGAIGAVLMVHLAFLVTWPDHFIHEDGGAYVIQAESILKGQYIEDAIKRPYGVAVFLVLLSKLFGPHILVFVVAQHLASVGTALLIAATVRMAGAPRFFALLAFLFAALHGRIIHYDNTVGAETITNFLVALAAFIAAGAVFRKWPVVLASAAVGLTLGAVMVCRSAAIGQAAVILLWLLLMLDAGVLRRLGAVALATVLASAVYSTPAAINAVIGKTAVGSESAAVMAFVVGYSGDFDHGVHLDRKAQARPFVEQMRAADTPSGWADGGEYQWPFGAVGRLKMPGDTDADLGRVVRDIFIETLTTPSTLYRHLTKHFLREMYFLLFDGNAVARQTPNPQAYEFFVKRDASPFFDSPTGLKPGQLVQDYYKPWWPLSRLLPGADGVQLGLSQLMGRGYAPNSGLVKFCCGLKVSTEYDDRPGPIVWLSGATLLLALILLVGVPAGYAGGVRQLPRGLVAVGALMVLLALVSAAFPTFLIYGLNRYAYYTIPFLGGASAVLLWLSFDRIVAYRSRSKPSTRVTAT